MVKRRSGLVMLILIGFIGIIIFYNNAMIRVEAKRKEDVRYFKNQQEACQRETAERIAELEERLRALEGSNNGETDSNSGGAESNS